MKEKAEPLPETWDHTNNAKALRAKNYATYLREQADKMHELARQITTGPTASVPLNKDEKQLIRFALFPLVTMLCAEVRNSFVSGKIDSMALAELTKFLEDLGENRD